LSVLAQPQVAEAEEDTAAQSRRRIPEEVPVVAVVDTLHPERLHNLLQAEAEESAVATHTPVDIHQHSLRAEPEAAPAGVVPVTALEESVVVQEE
jgi:hypothetical protein